MPTGPSAPKGGALAEAPSSRSGSGAAGNEEPMPAPAGDAELDAVLDRLIVAEAAVDGGRADEDDEGDRKNREQDPTHGAARHFHVLRLTAGVGLLFVVLPAI